MDEATRLLYLEAMGITQWQLKTSAAPAPITVIEHQAVDAQTVSPRIEADASPHELAPTVAEAQHLDPTLVSTNLAIETLAWDALQSTVTACTQCGLCQTRTQTVFGSGNPQADWLLIGEAPGQQEDLHGVPFVGPAGQLLTEMLRAIGLDREQVYIANILKCRPPGNRDPAPDEVEHCRPYLERQIALIQPKIILAVGRIAAQTLLHSDAPVGKLRGKIHTLNHIPLVVVYHPSYLLRSPLEKKKAWLDLQLALNTYQNNNNKG